MNKSKVINQLMKLHSMQLLIDVSGGPDKCMSVFDKYCKLREKILMQFGLPYSFEFGKILFIKNFEINSNPYEIYYELKNAAEKYLLDETKSDLTFLQECINNKSQWDIVLPKIDIPLHVYNRFVYVQVLQKKRDNVENGLNAMRFARDNNLLNDLGILALCEDYFAKEKLIVNKLKKQKVKYLNEFLFHHINHVL